MMKSTLAVSTGVALLYVVPSALPGDDEVRTLEQALAQTLRGVEVLQDLQTEVATEPTEATVEALLAATEDTTLEPEARDAELAAVRDDVQRLQRDLDQAVGALPIQRVLPWDELPPRGPELDLEAFAPSGRSPGLGLSPSMRTYLASLVPEPVAAPPGESGVEPPAEEPVPAEAEAAPQNQGHGVNALRQAQAAYRAEDYERALEIFESIDSTPDVAYWRARTLERLGRLDEAAAAYTEVIETGEGGIVDRAKTDLEFLEWKRRFDDAPGGSGS